MPSALNGWRFSCSVFWGVVQGVQRCFLVRLVLTSYRWWAESFFCLFLLRLGICRCRYPVFNEKYWHFKKYFSWLFYLLGKFSIEIDHYITWNLGYNCLVISNLACALGFSFWGALYTTTLASLESCLSWPFSYKWYVILLYKKFFLWLHI